MSKIFELIIYAASVIVAAGTITGFATWKAYVESLGLKTA